MNNQNVKKVNAERIRFSLMFALFVMSVVNAFAMRNLLTTVILAVVFIVVWVSGKVGKKKEKVEE